MPYYYKNMNLNLLLIVIYKICAKQFSLQHDKLYTMCIFTH